MIIFQLYQIRYFLEEAKIIIPAKELWGDTNFSNADLREAIFLTQGQINSAKGNRSTKLPKHLDYPVTWK